MRIQNSVLRNERQEEVLDPEGKGAPFLTMKVDIDTYIGKCSPWHWHHMFEIAYAANGSLDYDIPGQTVTLGEGDILFLNSSVLHTVKAHGVEQGCILYCILFDSHFLSGLYNSTMEEKYFRPLRANADLPYLHFPASHPLNPQLRQSVLQVLSSDVNERFGYEFEVQSELAIFFSRLLPDIQRCTSGLPSRSTVSIARVKQMIRFIRSNYSETLTLDRIAAAANLSRRECSRCFQRVMHLSPMEYLTQVRIDAAAERLTATSDSITDIAGACGFSSGSYFTSVFRRAMGVTPREYRTEHSGV